jgi:hypothetical protein
MMTVSVSIDGRFCAPGRPSSAGHSAGDIREKEATVDRGGPRKDKSYLQEQQEERKQRGSRGEGVIGSISSRLIIIAEGQDSARRGR